jgi:hypothetical protein
MAMNRWRQWPWYVNPVNVALATVAVVTIFWVRWMILQPHWLEVFR